ncbi:MAG: hypothetical protein Q9159_000387 [Coniocarpon cinnabarinum]
MTSRPSTKPPPLPTSPTNPTAPSPRTPSYLTRSISSINSPSLSTPNAFRVDDEIYVYHLTSTSLRLGLGGEAIPRSYIRFSPELQQRPGNYEKYLRPSHEYLKPRRKVPKAEHDGGVEEWGRDRELYRPDLRGMDIGLLGDTLERAIRQAHVEDVLVLDESSRKRQAYLVISSSLPQPLLQAVLRKVFDIYPQPSTLTLLSENVMCAVAAGLRSALVVDLGWHETVVSAICEYREVRVERSQAGGKRLSWTVARMLQDHLPDHEQAYGVTSEDLEELVHRVIWCRNRQHQQLPRLEDNHLEVTLPSLPSSTTISIPLETLSEPTESTFFSSSSVKPSTPTEAHAPPTPPPDENLTPLPTLLYNTLLHIPPDIRGILFSRIIFTGGCSNIPGIKARILTELANLIRKRGWSTVANFGRTNDKWRGINVEIAGLDSASPSSSRTPTRRSSEETERAPTPPDSPSNSSDRTVNPADPDSQPATAQPTACQSAVETPSPHPRDQAQEPDPLLARLHNTTAEAITSHVRNEKITLRAIHTLGPWAGASLLSGLRVKGAVEIERDEFLRYGLEGYTGDRGREGRGGRMSGVSPSKRTSAVSPSKRASNVSPTKGRVSGVSPTKGRMSGVSPEKRGRMSTFGFGRKEEGVGLGIWG